jgi:hypothetical protein
LESISSLTADDYFEGILHLGSDERSNISWVSRVIEDSSCSAAPVEDGSGSQFTMSEMILSSLQVEAQKEAIEPIVEDEVIANAASDQAILTN